MIPIMLPGSGRVHAAEGEFADETLCGILRHETGLGVFDVITDGDLSHVDCRVCLPELNRLLFVYGESTNDCNRMLQKKV